MLFLGAKGHKHNRFPWVSLWLVAANVLVFAAQVVVGPPLTYGFSLVPEEITTFEDLTGTTSDKAWVQQGDRTVEKDVKIQHYPGPVPICLTLFTSMFMHGGFFHLFFNMWCLLIFGRNVESAMGPRLYLAFYLACGLLAGLAHVASAPHSTIPYLGASGAIAGLMGAYVSIYPLNMIKVWLVVPFELPALLVIGGWVILQYLLAVAVDTRLGGVAYWAHLGGFFAGFVLLRIVVFVLRRRSPTAEAGEEKTAAPGDQDAAADSLLSSTPDPGHDPYAGFVTMQTIRRMREQNNGGRGRWKGTGRQPE
jgi:membrane associated rhomboid family serine protease